MGVAPATGGARGIGRGIALRLAADGHDVAVADLPSTRAEADAVAGEVDGRAVDVDVSDADRCLHVETEHVPRCCGDLALAR